MLSEKKHWLYRRLLLLRLLCACLAVFGTSTATERVLAARCIQDCAPDGDACNDACSSQCAASDSSCNSCLANCQSEYHQCLSYAVWCSGGGYSYSAHCQVGYADHCPIINGNTQCNDPSAHSGYYQLCDYGPGGQQCVACPNGETCTGANGAPPCP